MDYLFLIALFSACFAVIWISALTHINGLLHFIPKHYPSFLIKPLTCHVCLAGWVAGAISPFFVHWLLIAPCMVFAMVGAQIVREYGKFQ